MKSGQVDQRAFSTSHNNGPSIKSVLVFGSMALAALAKGQPLQNSTAAKNVTGNHIDAYVPPPKAPANCDAVNNGILGTTKSYNCDFDGKTVNCPMGGGLDYNFSCHLPNGTNFDCKAEVFINYRYD